MRANILDAALETRLLLTGILNGGFDVADVGDSAFVWEAAAAVVMDGRAVLAEDTRLQPALRQTFDLPAGAERLELTIHELALARTGGQPPDAIEIALLDPDTLQPLVDPPAEPADADAFVNIDADGHVRFGTGTTVPGAAESGHVAVLQFPLTITTDVSGLAAGTRALLVIELLAFGDVDAHATIDDVRLHGDLPPELSLAIDTATDSGRAGDAYTNFTTINLVGRTDPQHDVALDTDGDGFDDGTVTADSQGRFDFSGLVPAATTTYRARVENAHGPAIAERTVIVDTELPAGRLATPAPRAVVHDDPGFVDVVWEDTGPSGLDTASFTPADVSVSGVTIDRVERLAGGRVRYWYADDGDALPYGPIQVRLEAGAVEDRAGNASLSAAEMFRHLVQACPWHNAAQREDTDTNRHVVPLDALVVINQLNARPPGADSRLPALPPADTRFHLVDVNCDGHLTPLDALVIINWLNEHRGR